jgi:hypothetical protein
MPPDAASSLAPPQTERPRLSPAQGAHDHGHGHSHEHGHAHDPSLIRPPGFSLLRLSALARLGGALALSAVLWLGVWWALT